VEINFLNLFVVLQSRRRTFQRHPTGLQHITIIGDAERKRDRLFGK
jgi:hypothetical protein